MIILQPKIQPKTTKNEVYIIQSKDSQFEVHALFVFYVVVLCCI